jgi:hypothetical protein
MCLSVVGMRKTIAKLYIVLTENTAHPLLIRSSIKSMHYQLRMREVLQRRQSEHLRLRNLKQSRLISAPRESTLSLA